MQDKRKITDTAGWAFLEALFYMLAGQLIVGMILGVLLVVISTVSGTFSLSDLAGGQIINFTPLLDTVIMYLESGFGWIVVLPFLLIFKSRRPIVKSLGTGMKGNNIKFFLLGILIGGGLNVFCGMTALLHKDISISFESLDVLGLLLVFVCVFLQSSFEELVCRGVLYQLLMKRYNKPVIAIFGNAALFGVLHLANSGVTVLSVINIVVVGVFFSLMVYYFDSIWCAMAAHTAWNYMQNIVLGLPNSGNMSEFSVFKLDTATARNSIFYNTGFGIEGSLVCDLVLILGCVLLFLYGSKKGLKPTSIWNTATEQTN